MMNKKLSPSAKKSGHGKREIKFAASLNDWLTSDLMSDWEQKIVEEKRFSSRDADKMFDMLQKIYKMSHALSGSCKNPHGDWQGELNQFLNEL
ncbi:MAG: hypothetical protein ACE5D4_08790 [Thermodesulfobacteriota bacterium]